MKLLLENWKSYLNEGASAGRIIDLVMDIKMEVVKRAYEAPSFFNAKEAEIESEKVFNEMGKEKTYPFKSYKELAAAFDDLSVVEKLFDAASDVYDLDSKEEIKDYLFDNGYKVIGFGQGRVVVSLNNGKVGKIAYNSNGIEQNKRETKIWNSLKSDLLMPVLESEPSGLAIISLLGSPCGEECEEEIEKAKKILKSEFAKIGIGSFVDVHNLANWGTHEGKIKLFDYGS
jgi:hypothetical protein